MALERQLFVTALPVWPSGQPPAARIHEPLLGA